MAKAEPTMNSIIDQTRKAKAMKETSVAKDELGKHDGTTCMTHVHTAMNMMK